MALIYDALANHFQRFNSLLGLDTILKVSFKVSGSDLDNLQQCVFMFLSIIEDNNMKYKSDRPSIGFLGFWQGRLGLWRHISDLGQGKYPISDQSDVREQHMSGGIIV